jgi:hypothetical protein
MEIIKCVVYNLEIMKNFSININIKKIQLNDFKHRYFTSALTFCSKVQISIQ